MRRTIARPLQIFVRIDAADDATPFSFNGSHSQPPALTVRNLIWYFEETGGEHDC